MCELAFVEYNPTFDSIMPFPCFFDVTRKTSKGFLIIVIFSRSGVEINFSDVNIVTEVEQIFAP
jgi:hypothetical protein